MFVASTHERDGGVPLKQEDGHLRDRPCEPEAEKDREKVRDEEAVPKDREETAVAMMQVSSHL